MQDLARRTLLALRERGMKLATAESCTGGLIAAALTDIPGASDVFERGFVTYSNESKTDLLGVPADTIARHGAVSPQVAEAMAAGALNRSRAAIAVSCTGIAGPDGGSAEKPVGLVYIGIAAGDGTIRHFRHVFDGHRDAVRRQTVSFALSHVMGTIGV